MSFGQLATGLGRAFVYLLVAICTPSPALGRPGAARPYEVAMVLPRSPGEIELAFEEYFTKRSIPLRITVLASSDLVKRGMLITQLRQLQPDLIYTWGTAATLAVTGTIDSDPRQYIHDIPVVFTSISDPLTARLVSRLDLPGRNLTGISPLAPLAVQMNAIRAYRTFDTLGFLYDAGANNPVRQSLRELAAKEHFTLFDEPVPRGADGRLDQTAIAPLVRQLGKRGADFLYLGPETFVTQALQDEVARAALEAGLPTFAALENTVRRSGALFGISSPQANVGRFAAFKAIRIPPRNRQPPPSPSKRSSASRC
jgi:putative ABC transport system substrate-binding protein